MDELPVDVVNAGNLIGLKNYSARCQVLEKKVVVCGVP